MSEKRSLPRELLTDEESDRLLAQCDTSPAGIRNRALLLLLEGTGCRIAEALALEPRDLDWDEGLARIREGNGGYERLIPVAPEAMVALRAWLDQRKGAGIEDRAPVFCGTRGRQRMRALSLSHIRRWLTELGRRAGIDKRVHAHGFRHRFTSRLVRQGVVITSICYVLGHQSVASTYEYLLQLGLDHALDDVQSALDANDRFAGAPGGAELGLPEGAMGRSDGVRTRRPGQKRDRVKCARGRR